MTALHLAGPDDAGRLLPMIAAFHEETGISQKPEARAEALMPLLEGSPYGVAYLVGPARAPIGYVVICFGWSLEMGGMDGFLDEIYIRPGVRGRGIGSEVLQNLPKALAGAGLKALHLEARRDDPRIEGFYRRNKFELRPDTVSMTRRL
ncbi:GNAT family N-acetyltransferase [Pseudooceanicola nanhaiensis]|uniref:GNAT family N-acetyltransferase n=1 Tax=Pseudooceanicola nanhaiensis TaxID=375761 RepID=UPI004057E47D